MEYHININEIMVGFEIIILAFYWIFYTLRRGSLMIEHETKDIIMIMRILIKVNNIYSGKGGNR